MAMPCRRFVSTLAVVAAACCAHALGASPASAQTATQAPTQVAAPAAEARTSDSQAACLSVAAITKPPAPQPDAEDASDLHGNAPGTQPATRLNQDVCVAAHVYDVVELADGTRFLDVCAADVSDRDCRFAIISMEQDRDQVGDLRRYRDQDVHLRGVVRSMHGRMGIVLSHERQFHGGPEKFRPNPRLLRGFSAESDRPPVRDPNLRASGHHRSFMNTRDQETLAPARKP